MTSFDDILWLEMNDVNPTTTLKKIFRGINNKSTVEIQWNHENILHEFKKREKRRRKRKKSLEQIRAGKTVDFNSERQ